MFELPIAEQIYQLEILLLHPEVRRSETDFTELIADDFIEFGSSGRIYNKQQVLEALLNAQMKFMELRDFQARILAPEVVLTTFIISQKVDKKKEDKVSLHSSIWKFINGRWQIVFHQGTVLPARHSLK